MKYHIFLMRLHIRIQLNEAQARFYHSLCKYHGLSLCHMGKKYWIKG